MSEVNGADWLTAVDAHPCTRAAHLAVAATVVLTDQSLGLESIEGLSRPEVDRAVEDLIGLGFFEDVFSVGYDGGEEHVLELRLP